MLSIFCRLTLPPILAIFSHKIASLTLKVSLAIYEDLMVGTVARVIKQYGASHGRSLQALGIFNSFCKNKADLRCHCIAKHPHYCSMGEALRYLSITFPEGSSFLI